MLASISPTGASGHTGSAALTQSFINPTHLFLLVKGDSLVGAKTLIDSAARAKLRVATAHYIGQK